MHDFLSFRKTEMTSTFSQIARKGLMVKVVSSRKIDEADVHRYAFLEAVCFAFDLLNVGITEIFVRE